MTNYEYYKGDAEALEKAHEAICFGSSCDDCKLGSLKSKTRTSSCKLAFACAEYAEPKPPAPPKRRVYTFEEAKGLIGKRLEYKAGKDCRMEVIFSINYRDNAVYLNHGSCSFYMEVAKNATIDGQPFGVLEGGAE